MRNVDYLQQNIRTEINAAQPLGQFQSAALLVDARQQQRWRVTNVNDFFLSHFEFDAASNLVQNKLKDLFGLDVPGVTAADLLLQIAVPIAYQDYLDVYFQGWEFQRGIVRYETISGSSNALGFVVKINVGQVVYYTHLR